MTTITEQGGAKRRRWTTRAAALIASAAVALGGFALPTVAGAVEPTPTAASQTPATEDTAFDYYAGIAGLPSDHVFENITLERLEDILANGDGNYAILIGGTWDANVTKALPAIDKAAKANGVKKVYNFDPHLDNAGDTTLVDINDKTNKVEAFAKRFQETIGTYKLESLQSKDASKVVDLPTLFTYNRAASGDRVLSRIAGAAAVADEAQDAKVLSAIANKAATRTNGQFYVDYYLNHVAQGSASVFKAGEENNVNLVSVTYGELEKILKSEGNHYIFFGATWCGNTYATIRYVNQEARKYGVKHVYTFDTILDNKSGKDSPFHIRDNYSKNATGDHPLADLYTHLVNTYLPNLVTEDGVHGVIDSKGVGATRLQVPLLLHYNKDNKAQLAGTDQPAGPITDEVVDYHGTKYNVDTKPQPTALEYMLTWVGTTYDDAKIIPGGYAIRGDDLKPAKNYGRTVNNDRDAYIAQLDHFYSLIAARARVAEAKAVSLKGYGDAKVKAYNAAIAKAEATLANKNATIDATDGASADLAAAYQALTAQGGNNGGSNNGGTNNGGSNNGGSNNTGNNGGNTGSGNHNTGSNKGDGGNRVISAETKGGNDSLANTGSSITTAFGIALALLATASVSLIASRRLFARKA
ncbi:hypothetical protein [Bifidobacterium jacchi]|uniref:LPXTG cell wall anchor domain-containing protein n=1 Tax=Bifidobacterium jacchi TaxID=2490545 RepID=A0A5N5RHF2_9BIFI|nr:hypothetical protein [Bifidobacterium jacchi]KAB5606360.1 hypothetical protein EHS19_07665 [Bifidobacterium jacchi]